MWPAYGRTDLHRDDILATRAEWGSEFGKRHKILVSRPGEVARIVAAPGNKLYRRDINGDVWQYNRRVIGKWEMLWPAEHLDSVVEQIDASSRHLFYLSQGRATYRWREDKDSLYRVGPISRNRNIIRAARDGKAAYRLEGGYRVEGRRIRWNGSLYIILRPRIKLLTW